jgi:putative methyltransferase (TIGR04325 family)
MTARTLLRAVLPPFAVTLARRWSGRALRFRQVEQDWATATARSAGYDDRNLVEKVTAATREVVAGRAAYERDSVTFQELDHRFPALAALMHNAAVHGGRLEVVDFGGALGSTYWHSRPFLQGLASVRWRVVEQPALAEVGQREFASEGLTFDTSLPATGGAPFGTLALCGSVLQYLQHPGQVLADLAGLPVSHLLIDRTPMHDGAKDHLTIQQVPPHIYDASYPCWILSRPRLLEALAPQWVVLAEFGSDEGSARTDDGVDFEFRGIYLERRR